jgi:hypothetical protein
MSTLGTTEHRVNGWWMNADHLKRNSLHLQRASSPIEPRSVEEIVKQPPVEPIDWWKRVESSYANCKPDAEKPENYRTGNYVPQYDVAKPHVQEGAPQPEGV